MSVQIYYDGKFWEGELYPVEETDVNVRQPFFPKPYDEMLTVKREDNQWKIMPKRWLGAENFRNILQIVKQYGGKYVSAGKNSHFTIPVSPNDQKKQ
jgi:hypothetical protein